MLSRKLLPETWYYLFAQNSEVTITDEITTLIGRLSFTHPPRKKKRKEKDLYLGKEILYKHTLNTLQCHSKQFWQKLQLSWWFNLKRWNSKKRLREKHILCTPHITTQRERWFYWNTKLMTPMTPNSGLSCVYLRNEVLSGQSTCATSL